MKADKPSVTARFVALTRATLDRPTVQSGVDLTQFDGQVGCVDHAA